MLDDLDEAMEELGCPSDLWDWYHARGDTIPVIVRCISQGTGEDRSLIIGEYSDGGASFNREVFELVCSKLEYEEAWRNR